MVIMVKKKATKKKVVKKKIKQIKPKKKEKAKSMPDFKKAQKEILKFVNKDIAERTEAVFKLSKKYKLPKDFFNKILISETKKEKKKKRNTKKAETSATEVAEEIPIKNQIDYSAGSDENVKKYKEILKDKDLFKKMFGGLKDKKTNEDIPSELDKKIVGEVEGRKVLGLCAYGGRLVKNCQTASFNIMVNDDAGTGKDYVVNACMELLPKQYYIKKTRISPTVLNYWKSDEPQWTWNGVVLVLEDISESILNHDVFKVMCSSGTSATIVKEQKVIDLEVNGKPVMIITTATATPNPELTRRFVILNLDGSKNQTKEIMKRHSEFRADGIVPEMDYKYKMAMQYLERVDVKIPFANDIYKHFPINNIIMRTHYPRFLDYISASAGFHQFQRKKEEGFVLATGQDYDLARECFMKLCSNKYMIPLTINQKKILDIFEKEPELKGTISELHSGKMSFVSDRALSYNLRLLSNYGILETNPTINAQNKTVECYGLSKGYKPNEKIVIPTFEQICRIASEPSEPDTPSIPSIPSIPKKNIKKEGFSEVAKVAKREIGFGEKNVCENPKLKKIMEEFS